MSVMNGVKTKLVDPRSHSDRRTEFRIDDGNYAGSWKLIDVGLYDTQLTGAEGLYYPSINGVNQTIRGISLYSGTTLIDSIDYAGQFSTIASLQTSNAGSMDLQRQTLLNGMGLSEQSVLGGRPGAMTMGPRDVVEYNTIDGDPAHNNQVPLANESEDRQSGIVTLSDFLGFFRQPLLAKIPDLRLVIEWDTTVADYFNDPAHPLASPSLKVIRPTLVLDEFIGEVPAVQDYAFDSVITERVEVPAKANDALLAKSSYKLQGFRSRFLKHLVLYNMPSSDLTTAADRWLTRSTRSVAQKGEVLQVTVNSQELLPDSGIDNEALRLHLVNDTLGRLNMPLASSLYSIRDGANFTLAGNTDALVGQYAIAAIPVNQVVDSLKLHTSRLYGSTPSSREAYSILVFGTVSKLLEVKGGRVRVSA